MSKKRRSKTSKQLNGVNRHHLIFQGRHYNSGYAKMLRERFVRPLDIKIHNELHNAVLHDVPRPSDAQIKAMWLDYQANQEAIDQMDIVDACEWLMQEGRDQAWTACMARQWQYLKTKLKPDKIITN